MFRHGTYYIIANDSDKTLETIVINYANTIGFNYHYEKHVYYITVNGNWVLDHKTQFGYISKYIVPIEDFRNTEIGFHMMRYTFCIDTQISTSRELNRVSPNNIAEKSTRYVYEDGTICRPHWMSDEIATHFNEEPLFADWIDDNIEHQKAYHYISSCNNSACGKYCNKHYHQIKRYGDIKTRTRFDKNEIIINDNVAKILLYNNNCNVIDYTIIDAEDINKISKYKISKCGNYAYANINNKRVALHRIITNTIDELDKIHNPIDHINGNCLDK